MGNFRLRQIPLRECVDLTLILDIRDAAFPSGVERLLKRFQASEILAQEVRGLPELVTHIEQLQPVLLRVQYARYRQ